MGSTAIFLISTLTALNLGHAVLQIMGNVMYERSRRATLVAVLGLAREGAVQLLVHHDPVNCDVRAVNARPSATLPDRLTRP
ncbi:hypothetical protein [Streptomyces tauricus]|uniref:Uncharacterized protein n=1 Tax=Streptomyces tauricus TaxID=68274 RepID=A0ABZ1JAQ4_9ACTN|nr:hypothetical protein [Streptomyces tauricus]